MKKKRRHEDHEEHIDESWLIPYADLLTLLLALFIVLYSMNSVDVKKFEEMSRAFSIALNQGSGVLDMPSVVEKGPNTEKVPISKDKDHPNKNQNNNSLEDIMKQEQAEFQNLKKQIDEYIDNNGLTSDLETKLNLSQLLITISDNALFAPAQATVKPEAKDLAIAISKMLEQYPNYEIIVSGHTDDTPINNAYFKSNWDLSSMRAIRFMDVMLENKNIGPERFSAIGYGEYRPIAPNDSVNNKAKNRRVEVAIIHTYIDSTSAQKLSTTDKTQ